MQSTKDEIMPVRCDECKGRKKVIGMGGISKACAACNGIGWINSEPEVVETPPKKTRKKKV